MRSISSYPVTGFQFRRGLAGLPGLIASLLLLIAVSLSPAHALEIPSDEEQEVLIRSTLMTFNDANMTGNSPFAGNSSSRNIPPSRHLPPSRRSGRTNCFSRRWSPPNTNSWEKAKFDPDGALVLAGVFKTDELEVKYRLRFVQSNKVWKVLGIKVDATRLACSDRRFAQLPNYRSDDCSSRAAWVSSSSGDVALQRLRRYRRAALSPLPGHGRRVSGRPRNQRMKILRVERQQVRPAQWR